MPCDTIAAATRYFPTGSLAIGRQASEPSAQPQQLRVLPHERIPPFGVVVEVGLGRAFHAAKCRHAFTTVPVDPLSDLLTDRLGSPHR